MLANTMPIKRRKTCIADGEKRWIRNPVIPIRIQSIPSVAPKKKNSVGLNNPATPNTIRKRLIIGVNAVIIGILYS